MFKQNYFKVFCLFLFFLCVSCSKHDNSYFPLNKGVKWQYDVVLETQDGLLNQKYIFKNLGEDELNGTPVYLRQSLDGSILYYENSDEGIYYLGNKDTQTINPEFHEDRQLILPSKLIVGTEWEDTTLTKLLKKTVPSQKSAFELIVEIPIEVKIESLNETVTVSAGRFYNCMKVSMEGFDFKDLGNHGITMVSVEQTNWYALGVGLVKMERLETAKRKALGKATLLVELAKFDSD